MPEGAQIGFAHLRVVADGCGRALGDHGAAVEHGHVMGERQDEVHVVLDHDDGEVLGEALHEGAQGLHGAAAQAAGGLVQQQQLRLARQGHPDLEQAPLAIGEELRRHVLAAGQPDEPHRRRRLVRRRRHLARGRPQVEAAPPHGGHCHADVLQHRVVVEQVEDLERAADADARSPVGREPGDVAVGEVDAPRVGSEDAGEEIETGGLARAIGPDEGGEPPALEAETHVVQDHVATEGLAEAARLEDGGDGGGSAGGGDAGRHSALRAASAARVSWKPLGRRTRWMRPRMPSGMKRMMPMKRRP